MRAALPCEKIVECFELFEGLSHFSQVQLEIGNEFGAERREGRGGVGGGKMVGKKFDAALTFWLWNQGVKKLGRGCHSYSSTMI